MKKITFLVLHLGYGGIEKAVTSLANLLCNDYKIEIISTYKIYNKPPFEINDKVSIVYLLGDLKPNKKELLSAFKTRKIFQFLYEIIKAFKVLYLRRKTMKDAIIKSDSDIIISTRFLFNSLLSKYGPNRAVKIAQEHRHHNNSKKYIK